ncbi:hypothetical protein SMGD1_1592 [Sulfurimonas gotlandica GD1]|uniref:VCBS repeat-containing protein n=1 Tax=Sulfurimonas gotlandica (strain DSM 19862 / JCM 16533 / GD1) TaxID=929558 RepID=B6BHW4_SULGG|nr:hypothetical protein [Sulfurimonas gotlandica]EDZ63343.1 conserved hypothetical protein [Sulfurimonas gotlandica GD1]EHP30116.1 hypothetical protein SMGD1_1592 [Sulfurimonas gotlandica GD1]
MKIEQSEVSFLSSHRKSHELYESESLEMWNREEDAPQRLRRGDRLELTEDFKKFHKPMSEVAKLEDEMFDESLDPKLMAIVRALEALTGRKINISFMHNLKASESVEATDDGKKVQENEVERLGWGINYHYERTEIKKESLHFSVSGSVKTADGRETEFALAFSIKQEFQSHESISIKAGDALIDPLVLNFGSNIVTISDVKHNFDLDLDGKSDEFSFVGSGSGFLALDKNKDGIINDGSELFGPKSGNGFNDLKAYDSDNNGWIDENDAVFEQLIIWTKDADSTEHLFSLKDKDVGALYLGREKTPFELKSSNGTMQALIRESSIYLKEEGGVGTLQELDLVV